MTDIDERGRPEPPLAADEAGTLVGFLEYQRATFAWKASGLDSEGLTATVGVSTMTIGGMLQHLALCEESWFSERLWDRGSEIPWAEGVDWSADPDFEWRTAAEKTPDELRAAWERSVARCRAFIAEAMAEGGLGQLARRPFQDGRAASLRWILCHMIEEYARHNGHADLIRETVDGETGE